MLNPLLEALPVDELPPPVLAAARVDAKCRRLFEVQVPSSPIQGWLLDGGQFDPDPSALVLLLVKKGSDLR
jgi:hypothetical protein